MRGKYSYSPISDMTGPPPKHPRRRLVGAKEARKQPRFNLELARKFVEGFLALGGTLSPTPWERKPVFLRPGYNSVYSRRDQSVTDLLIAAAAFKRERKRGRNRCITA